jgi:hypothetical protein
LAKHNGRKSKPKQPEPIAPKPLLTRAQINWECQQACKQLEQAITRVARNVDDFLAHLTPAQRAKHQERLTGLGEQFLMVWDTAQRLTHPEPPAPEQHPIASPEEAKRQGAELFDHMQQTFADHPLTKEEEDQAVEWFRNILRTFTRQPARQVEQMEWPDTIGDVTRGSGEHG